MLRKGNKYAEFRRSATRCPIERYHALPLVNHPYRIGLQSGLMLA